MFEESKKAIDDFLALERLAFIGVSRDRKKMSRLLYAELLKGGYAVAPVNPNAAEIEGAPCYGSVEQVPGQPRGAVVMVPGPAAEEVLRQCAKAGIGEIWVQRGVASGRALVKLTGLARELGLRAVTGRCLFMFLPRPAFPHNLHAFLLKVFKRYPR